MRGPLSYIELSGKALIANVNALASCVPHKKIVCVVKANAYGHGVREVVTTLSSHVDYFQVDDIEELRLVRTLTKKPVLVFGYVAKHELEEAVRLNATLSMYDIARLKILEQIGAKYRKTIPVHIKIDALLGRQGVLRDELPALLRGLRRLPHVSIEGVYSHFANIEDTTNMAHARAQVSALMNAVALFHHHGFTDFDVHISATSGILSLDSDLETTLVRIGVGAYGMWPSLPLERLWRKRIALTPVMRWVSHVAQVKTIPKGFPVGYGCTYIAKKEMKIAVIPQGYSDGYDRGLSNKGTVLVRGRRAPVIGRVAMNMFVVDVTKIPGVRQEDEVVLLGAQGKDRITAEEIADVLDTINYEITTRVPGLLPRVVS